MPPNYEDVFKEIHVWLVWSWSSDATNLVVVRSCECWSKSLNFKLFPNGIWRQIFYNTCPFEFCLRIWFSPEHENRIFDNESLCLACPSISLLCLFNDKEIILTFMTWHIFVLRNIKHINSYILIFHCQIC